MSKTRHLDVTSATTGRTYSVPVDRIAAVEPTVAQADIVMLSGERIPVRESVEKAQDRLTKLENKPRREVA